MKVEFVGIYAPFIQRYINFKRSLGYKFQNEYLFASFDRFTLENDSQLIGLTKQLCDKWGAKRLNETDVTRYKRINDIRNFSIYLNHLGYPSHIPKRPQKYSSDFTPYIFSQHEIKQFFDACDLLKLTGHSNISYILPTLFRLIYGCGLRLDEALRLKCKDVSLPEGYITVRNSKNGRDRRLPFSDSLKQALVQYSDNRFGGHMPNDYYFTKKNQDRCCGNSVYIWFRKILFKAGISHGGRGSGPRIHDFRHSFSVHSLKAMSEAGMDLYYSLPVLSNYLGHQSLEATDKYVRLTSDMYPELIQHMNNLCSYVFPEVGAK
jgi:integrase/recombinase XerD